MSIRSGIRVGPRQNPRVGANVGYGGGAPPSVPATLTILTQNQSSTDGTSVATAAFTPTANQVCIAIVAAFSAVSLTTPTASGNSLTWDAIGSVSYDVNRQITAFRAQGGSPSNGALTFDWGAIVQTSFIWVVLQYAGADTSGTNGSGAVPQFKTASTTGTSLSVTLDNALANPTASTTLVAVGSASTIATPDVDFTQIFERNVSTNTHRLLGQVATTNQLTCTTTVAGSQALGAIAIEIKAA